MNEAEAVERILRGRAWRIRENHRGVELDPTYREACEVLGRPVPERPPFPGLQVGDPIALGDDGRVKKAGSLAVSVGVVVGVDRRGQVQVALDTFGDQDPAAPTRVVLHPHQLDLGDSPEEP